MFDVQSKRNSTSCGLFPLHFAKEMEHIVDGTSFLLVHYFIFFFKSSSTETKKRSHISPNGILSKMLTCS